VDRWVFERTIRGAARVAVLNHEAAAQVQRGWGLDAIVLQAPVDLRVFRPMAARDPSRPRVLFPSDLSDPRKGGVLLLRAWNLVHRRCPEAELVLAGPYGHLIGGPSIDLRSALDGLVEPSARGTIDVRGPGALTDLPRLYSEAAVTVLPSVDEAFGMVLTESLACGTPVVCGDHGGPAEIVGDAGVGVTIPLASTQDLYRMTRAVQLADAILAAIDLAGHEGIAEQCRAHASQWSLDVIGEKVEAAYTEMMGERQRRGGGLAAIRPRSHAGGSF
jgi:glycosyltransferase involved in cell wall biosynthesis